jgi:ADP-heptose:LPS heptosyltransferase
MAEMLALLSSSILFVGIDAGILHVAGAVGTPCVGIFEPTDPECFLPRNCASIGVTGELTCIGCHHGASGPLHWMTGCPFDIRCMREVKATTVPFGKEQREEFGEDVMRTRAKQLPAESI